MSTDQTTFSSDGVEPVISVVMPTFRRAPYLDEALARVGSLRRTVPFEVIVVDDGGGDNTPEVVEGYAQSIPNLSYMSQENAGAGTARNTGSTKARGEIILFTDDDMLFQPDHLECHLAAHRDHGPCFVNGFWEFPPNLIATMKLSPFGRYRIELEKYYQESSVSYTPLDDGRYITSAIISGNLSIEKALFDELGGFEPTIPHAGLEDQELSKRATAAGCTLIMDPAIRIQHNESFSTLDSFCNRRRIAAYDTVYAAKVQPQWFAGREMITLNLPPKRSDRPRTIVRKLLKEALASSAGERALRGTISVLEFAFPGSAALHRAYWSLGGIYILRGVREAMAEVGPLQMPG